MAQAEGFWLGPLRDGSEHYAELHWYEAHGIGKKEMKIKDLVD